MYKLILVIFMLVAQQSGSTSDNDDNDKILALIGLPGVYVVIEDLNDHAKAGGLSTDDVRKEVVKRLKHGGIRMLSEQEWLTTRGYPMLTVSVTVAAAETKLLRTNLGHACWIEVTLDEMVYLERHTADEAVHRIFATVWRTSQLWMSGPGELPLAAKRGIGGKIDEFCRDIRLAKKLDASLPKPTQDND